MKLTIFGATGRIGGHLLSLRGARRRWLRLSGPPWWSGTAPAANDLRDGPAHEVPAAVLGDDGGCDLPVALPLRIV